MYFVWLTQWITQHGNMKYARCAVGRERTKSSQTTFKENLEWKTHVRTEFIRKDQLDCSFDLSQTLMHFKIHYIIW